MRLYDDLQLLLRISRSAGIVRRYFVTNGFDSALAMLGVIVGFRLAGGVDLKMTLQACLGAAVALMMSGLTSAYVSESAERRKELRELERTMITDLTGSAHARAATVMPWLVAGVNGLAPFVIALTIMSPLWLARAYDQPADRALDLAIGIAFVVICLLGIFLGRVSGTPWFWSMLRTFAIGVVTFVLIVLLEF